MSENETIMTLEGLKKMEEELEYLKTVRRKEIAARIRQAIEFGDISENSEYEDAKNEQAFIEGTIMALEKKLRNAKVIDESEVNIDMVSVGSIVRMQNLDTKDEYEYTIVGSVEADPSMAKISNESPIGKGILGAAVGQAVDVAVPAGTMHLKILAIRK